MPNKENQGSLTKVKEGKGSGIEGKKILVE
jgi:hypothetical protein